MFVDNRYICPDTWYDARGKAFQPQVHYYVGGATKLYGAALYRLRKEDFGELRHHDGVSPAWPISYDELEPYYTLAEQLYHVHGARGEDPTEPASSAPYPHPAVSHEPRIQQLSRRPGGDRAHTRSTRPAASCSTSSTCTTARACAARHATASRASSTRSPTPRCSACAPRWSTTTSRCSPTRTPCGWRPNAAGTSVTGVVVDHGGVQETFSADLVVVSCGAANSAKLLLASASEAHPNGLANGSDQVGRNYMFHNSQAVLALSKEPNPTVFQKTLGLNDFYFGTDDVDYPLGNIQMVGQVLGGDVPRARSRWRPAWRRSGRWRTSPATPSTSGCRPRTCPGRTTA